MASPFRFLACDWMTGTVLAELPLVQGSFERRLNGTGTFTANLPLGDSKIAAIDPFTSTQPARTHLYADLNGVLVGSWMVWSRSYDSTTKQLQLQGSETLSYFAHRFTQPGWGTVNYVNSDQAQIAEDLLLRVMADVGGTPANFTLNIPGTTGIQRNAVYTPGQLAQILQEIQTYGAMDKGFDWATDCAYVGGIPSTTFTLSFPRRGVTYGQSGLVFEFPGNVLKYTWPEDGASSANDCWAIGAGTPPLLSEAEAEPLFTTGGFPLLERVGSYLTITDQPSLDAKVAQDLIAFQNDRMAPPATAWQGTGLIVPSVEVLADADPVLGSYTVGDECRLRVTDERFPAGGLAGAGIDTAYRIVAYVIKPGDQGTPATSTIALGPAL